MCQIHSASIEACDCAPLCVRCGKEPGDKCLPVPGAPPISKMRLNCTYGAVLGIVNDVSPALGDYCIYCEALRAEDLRTEREWRAYQKARKRSFTRIFPRVMKVPQYRKWHKNSQQGEVVRELKTVPYAPLREYHTSMFFRCLELATKERENKDALSHRIFIRAARKHRIDGASLTQGEPECPKRR